MLAIAVHHSSCFKTQVAHYVKPLCRFGSCSRLSSRFSKLITPSNSKFTARRYSTPNLRIRAIAGEGVAMCTPPAEEGVQKLIDDIIKHGTKAVLYVTGGGVTALTWLLTTPGASNAVLDVQVPYANSSLIELLGSEPEQYSSTETAVAMAKAAYRSAANFSRQGDSIAGVGCTCALKTNYPKKGDHKVIVATHTGLRTAVYCLKLAKDVRDRRHEDELASRLLIQALGKVVGVDADLLAGQLLDGSRADNGDGVPAEELQVEVSEVLNPIHELLNGRVEVVEYSGGQVYVDAPRKGRVYLPGSFNPIHQGHHNLMKAALQTRGAGCPEAYFELSVGNADKGFMREEEVARRVQQFTSNNRPLVITQAPLFTQKAELFPDSTFVVGYDTAIRLVKPEYYGDETAMLLQFAKLRYRGCSFLVGGRLDESGAFRTIDDLDVPENLQRGGLFEGIPEQSFRLDISSTELRQQGQGLVHSAS